ncbi:hypothetical protein SAMN03159341_104112 [Paenibacillus sp. 1_12]|uniref:hypothetical protein n=1 Tax=Paenibacillus sp. 1_12 TaxID=1566278 RepID=UPI0008EE57B0|nr:hypothetical protein [Paenibacillus sp. 1_12]SFL22559.1 hypothetical protein SAMN03159341_104112 [Paenibacillus sp. 1_12]
MSNEMSNTDSVPTVAIVHDHQDPFTSHASIMWAVEQLTAALASRQVSAALAKTFNDTPEAAVKIVIVGPDSQLVHSALKATNLSLPAEAESFAVAASSGVIVVSASDARGLIYAILELADRIQHSSHVIEELLSIESFTDKPANAIRSITRLFSCEPEDKPWFYDKSFWDEYLTELITQRFNRFSLALGMGYDYGHDPDVHDNYFCFSYPFLFDVPGYDIKVKELPNEEKQRNWVMLRYIGDEAKRRGLQFQLGLWNHSYIFTESPNQNYTIEGINPDNHAEYCREAIRILLKDFPAIDGLTFRVHYEGGIPEPAYEFWRVVMEGTKDAGRRVEIDMHAKGVNDELLKVALSTEQPIYLSPKYWAEHMGPSYHQAAIRDAEFFQPVDQTMSMSSITQLSRRFTRYGYADYLQEDRQVGILFRLWPGTQKLLLWGDPAIAAGYGRYSSFSGSQGIELCEPLTFKGRKGSGREGGREQYLEPDLQLQGRDWLKYKYTYRLWGRLLYNPDANPASWQRYLNSEFGQAASSYEHALAHSSRILPLITVAHLPSAANVIYWPEMYTNLPIVATGASSYYDFDTPKPGTFGAASPLDTALFYRVDEFADDITQGFRKGKYSPLETAGRLEQFTNTAEMHLSQAIRMSQNPLAPSFRRFAIDVAMLIDLGRFFADKFRASLAYALYERTHDRTQLEQALELTRSATHTWRHLVTISKDIYNSDIAFGFTPHVRGHWSDRLQAMEDDLAIMESKASAVRKSAVSTEVSEKMNLSSKFLQDKEESDRVAVSHQSPDKLHKGEALNLQLAGSDAPAGFKINLHYRHANQGEHYVIVEMDRHADGSFSAIVPATYTDSPYDLIYFFEIHDREGDVWMHPGLNVELSNQPYYLVSL